MLFNNLFRRELNSMYVKKVKLTNFKRFKNNEFCFNKGTNIVIGTNDSGKSTLLHAIDICLNQRGNGDWKNRNEYGTLLNIKARENFLKTKKLYSDLPKIRVEIEIGELENKISSSIFNGYNNSSKKESEGVCFEYSFDDQYKSEYEELIRDDIDIEFIPFEFYTAKWKTFGGETYSFRKNPFKSILIDTNRSTGDSYKVFTKQVFSTLSRNEQNNMSIELKKKIDEFNKKMKEEFRIKHLLEIDPNRFVIEDNLDVIDADKDILLRDMGSGTENIIKTQLAMDVNSKLILLEEPENHLSFDLARQQIEQIKSKDNSKQLIITTHSPLLASKLSISNLKWLNNEGKFISFQDIPQDTAQFFQKADNIDVLQVILSEKVILVEGATEYMIMEDMVKQVTGCSVNEKGIHVISMGGNYYKRFKDVVNKTKNRVLVITDNDGSEKRIEEAARANSAYLHIAMPNNIQEFTFETALFDENKSYFSDSWEESDATTSWKEHENLDNKLVYLLKNKTKSAFKYSNSIASNELKVPNYIEDGIKWLIETK